MTFQRLFANGDVFGSRRHRVAVMAVSPRRRGFLLSSCRHVRPVTPPPPPPPPSPQIFLYDCTEVSPFSLLFFGGDITIQKDEGEETVAVDEWIVFRSPARIAHLVKVSGGPLDADGQGLKGLKIGSRL